MSPKSTIKMKYFLVFALALIALFANVQSAAIEEPAQVEAEVPVDAEVAVPGINNNI